MEMKYGSEEIIKKRRWVTELFLQKSSRVRNSDITEISSRDLHLLFKLYDEAFFQNWFADCFPGSIKFSFSRRMTKSAGKTIYPKNNDPSKPQEIVIEVRISIDFIFNYGLLGMEHVVGGIQTRNSLDALQIILEHELVHVIEFIHFQQSNCRQKRFTTLAYNLFGHTESCHRLPTHQQIASQSLGLTAGSLVSFSFEGRRLKGIVARINKRATVMVRDPKGSYTDQQGNRYSKYYVPLQVLRPSSEGDP